MSFAAGRTSGGEEGILDSIMQMRERDGWRGVARKKAKKEYN
jgi:hypothetical protein